jgi:hypothetical protein
VFEGQTGEDEESYLCPKCGDREAVLDIPLVPQPDYASPGEKYFVSLTRCDNLQVRVGDTVSVLRAFKNKTDDSNNGNDGLLKIATITGKAKPKKKPQEKKKEKPATPKEEEKTEASKEDQSVPVLSDRSSDGNESKDNNTDKGEIFREVSINTTTPTNNADEVSACDKEPLTNTSEADTGEKMTIEADKGNKNVQSKDTAATSVTDLIKLDPDASLSESTESQTLKTGLDSKEAISAEEISTDIEKEGEKQDVEISSAEIASFESKPVFNV